MVNSSQYLFNSKVTCKGPKNDYNIPLNTHTHKHMQKTQQSQNTHLLCKAVPLYVCLTT